MNRSAIRYPLVSGLCLLLHNIVMIVSDYAGATLWLAVCLSYAVVVVAGYILHSHFTFENKARLSGFGRYAAAMSLNIPLAYITTWLWHDVAGFAMWVAAPLATAMMMVFNYYTCRWAIMSHIPLAKAGKTIS